MAPLPRAPSPVPGEGSLPADATSMAVARASRLDERSSAPPPRVPRSLLLRALRESLVFLCPSPPCCVPCLVHGV